MKKITNILALLSLLIMVAVACRNQTPAHPDPEGKTEGSEAKKESINQKGFITAINSNTSQVVNVQLASKETKTFSVVCRVFSSTTFDAENKIFGYVNCNSAYGKPSDYCMINLESGEEIKQIPLSQTINFVVLDPVRHVIIGHYHYAAEGAGYKDGTDHVLTVNLDNGSVISDKPFSAASLWNGTTYFFRDIENEYVLIRSDYVMVFINPSTGEITKTVSLETHVTNGIYDRKNDRLIGTCTDEARTENYIIAVDINTGNTLSKVTARGLGFYLGGETDYDAETNSYILVSSDNEVLFFNVETGEITEKYQLDFKITSLKFWRSSK